MTHPGDTADAVVIGAGPNGLVAANLLADAGWSVVVLEAADEPGGSVRSGEVTAPGFTTDFCSAFYPMSAVSPFMLGLDLERHGLAWRHAPDVLAHVLPDDRVAVLSRDIERTAESVAQFAERDGDAWREEFLAWQHIRDDLVEALFRPFPPVRAAARLFRRMGAGDALRFARRAVMPVRTLAEEQFSGEGAQLLYAGNALHTDLGPDAAGGAIFGWLLAMLGQDVGFPAPVGGAGEITSALVRRLESLGGRVDCGRRVDRVLIAKGTAVGVRDASGELVRARRAVLADVPAPSLYLELVGAEHLPSRMVDDLSRFHWDDSTVKVDWALSGPVPWTAKEVAGAGTVHLGGDLNGLARFSSQLACGQTPKVPFLLLGQMTTTDPSRSPRGTESVWAYTHVPRGQKWDETRLRRAAERVEQTIEKHAPGFTSKVLARHIAGPNELGRHNISLVDGAVNGGTAAIHQQLIFRPTPGLARPDTPVDRLYLASASAHPGGAVHGGPGGTAAHVALRRNGFGGDAYRAVISAVLNRLTA
ncbi:NAD(P)/FAD-dependent oxidoreductase [Allokutzneria multivorans]|uniref:Pyridine nucleotide-disulfide oxidoreductase domain-containing protein 2 n=1 Tax=Allokutzneria multivorans TaxID=1142134 RepID=A0ABP7U127_9PSEU